MPGPLYGPGQFSLMTGADSGSFFCPDFVESGYESPEQLRVFIVDFSDVALTKITRHKIELKIQISKFKLRIPVLNL
jgi:hypothetical protein